MDRQTAEHIIEKINLATEKKRSAVVGFDGFVDEVLHVVDTRVDEEHYQRICYLDDYGKRISAAAGLSLNIEMVPLEEKLGGNGTIFANSLCELGTELFYIGALGKKAIHPVFEDFAKKCRVVSVAAPAHTDAIEFYDGKIISSKLEALKDVNWPEIKKYLSPEKLAEEIDRCTMAGFENWSLLVHMTQIWEGIYQEVLPLMKSKERKILFLDLADPAKRTREDISYALQFMKKFEAKFRVILGLNEKEAYGIAAVLGKQKEEFQGLLQLAGFLRQQLEISLVVIHPVKGACADDGHESCQVLGPYCEKPRLTTGAGDNFNAGFIYGVMIGCSLEEALYLGTANSGFYVRNARSASRSELCAFLKDWGS